MEICAKPDDPGLSGWYLEPFQALGWHHFISCEHLYPHKPHCVAKDDHALCVAANEGHCTYPKTKDRCVGAHEIEECLPFGDRPGPGILSRRTCPDGTTCVTEHRGGKYDFDLAYDHACRAITPPASLKGAPRTAPRSGTHPPATAPTGTRRPPPRTPPGGPSGTRAR